MNENEFGGTKLQRRKPEQQMQGPPQQQMQMDPRQMQGPPQQQMQMQGPPQQQMDPRQMQGPPPQHIDPRQIQGPQMQMQMDSRQMIRKETFGKIDSKSMKYAILVILIFIILNSKIIWKQIMKLPMMGSIEPSIVALIINSILAGIIFYIVTTMLIK
jgi:hypothetical protein